MQHKILSKSTVLCVYCTAVYYVLTAAVTDTCTTTGCTSVVEMFVICLCISTRSMTPNISATRTRGYNGERDHI
ncbi:hypothetical protein P691DRAFT_401069 [Macrolepiota fuliginosa MF-IS2]|uniref:Uncharacterized protein n=1 Tax=Macrolepiota fuliginosa MF-IS2 TaxID=1400762 RepID=A0A9P6BXZ7_9AGAR|nr:hypothetical protein P691DRAFT_401069 [Macrolepiota fuliginosa MF-IS2]